MSVGNRVYRIDLSGAVGGYRAAGSCDASIGTEASRVFTVHDHGRAGSPAVRRAGPMGSSGSY
jgi:hypothetical protein